MILEYFEQLFTSEVHVIDVAVLEPFSTEDVRKATFCIGDYNGLHAVYYKKFYSFCGE
jgi:hypothetical protein